MQYIYGITRDFHRTVCSYTNECIYTGKILPFLRPRLQSGANNDRLCLSHRLQHVSIYPYKYIYVGTATSFVRRLPFISHSPHDGGSSGPKHIHTRPDKQLLGVCHMYVHTGRMYVAQPFLFILVQGAGFSSCLSASKVVNEARHRFFLVTGIA